MSVSATFGAPPRAASLRMVMTSRLKHIGQNVWTAMEAYGQRRAATQLRQTAALYAVSRPELAAQLRDGADACEAAGRVH